MLPPPALPQWSETWSDLSDDFYHSDSENYVGGNGLAHGTDPESESDGSEREESEHESSAEDSEDNSSDGDSEDDSSDESSQDDSSDNDASSVQDSDQDSDDDTFIIPAFVLDDFDDEGYFSDIPNAVNLPLFPQVQVVQVQPSTPPTPQASASKTILSEVVDFAKDVAGMYCIIMAAFAFLWICLGLFNETFLNPYPLPLRIIDTITPRFIPVETADSLFQEYAGIANKLVNSMPPSTSSAWYLRDGQPIHALCPVIEDLETRWIETVSEVEARGGKVGSRNVVDFSALNALCHDVDTELRWGLPSYVDQVVAPALGCKHEVTSSLDFLRHRIEWSSTEQHAMESMYMAPEPIASITNTAREKVNTLSAKLSSLQLNLDKLIHLSKKLISEERLSGLTAPPYYLRRRQAIYDATLERLDKVLYGQPSID